MFSDKKVNIVGISGVKSKISNDFPHNWKKHKTRFWQNIFFYFVCIIQKQITL